VFTVKLLKPKGVGALHVQLKGALCGVNCQLKPGNYGPGIT